MDSECVLLNINLNDEIWHIKTKKKIAVVSEANINADMSWGMCIIEYKPF